ncbi:hypothetical protein [Flavobacterium sp.]|jgi:hypothetical protein|uniref:hypothetical protein n=1 Tax=Flavobacterium sp. TaxID=239 RepID=UPI0037C124C2
MKINNISKLLVCTLLFLSPLTMSADDITDQEGDVADVPASPISDYAPVLLIGGLAVGYSFLRKRSVQ